MVPKWIPQLYETFVVYSFLVGVFFLLGGGVRWVSCISSGSVSKSGLPFLKKNCTSCTFFVPAWRCNATSVSSLHHSLVPVKDESSDVFDILGNPACTPENKWLELWRCWLGKGKTSPKRSILGVRSMLVFSGVYWVVPLPSNSGKWRFIGIPDPKHLIILVVAVTGKGDNRRCIHQSDLLFAWGNQSFLRMPAAAIKARWRKSKSNFEVAKFNF